MNPKKTKESDVDFLIFFVAAQDALPTQHVSNKCPSEGEFYSDALSPCQSLNSVTVLEYRISTWISTSTFTRVCFYSNTVSELLLERKTCGLLCCNVQLSTYFWP